MSLNEHILVLGAGVSGLSTGIVLLQKGYKVTIWAKDLPPNTTSNKAGAFWYPYKCGPQDKVIAWAKQTLQVFEKDVISDPNSGCRTITVIDAYNHPVDDPWWKECAQFKRCDPAFLPKGYVDGYQLNVIMMDTTLYMDYLVDMFKSVGGELIQKEVKTINEVCKENKIVVNCTGLGSRELCNDQLIYPSRGQTVKIKRKDFETILVDEEVAEQLAYVVPRTNDIILGGTFQENNWNLEADPKDTEAIIQRCAKLNPIFSEVEIIDVLIGLRPVRPEVRLEHERKGNNYIIHNYGHGGAGFTLSWGCAQDVCTVIETL